MPITPTLINYLPHPPRSGDEPELIPIDTFYEIYRSKGGQPFHYSEDTAVHEQKMDLSHMSCNQAVKADVLKFLQRGYTDGLIVCFISEEVGFGLFANRDFNPGDLVVSYAGLISKTDGDVSDYSFDLNTVTGKSQYGVDSAGQGGLARFAQHLPTSARRDLTALRWCRSSAAKLYNLLRFDGETQDSVKDIVAAYKYSTPSLEQELLAYREHTTTKNPGGYWHLDSLADSFELDRAQIACSNLGAVTVSINDVPTLIMYANSRIRKFEQLGFDYGLGYWQRKGTFPLLFSADGEVIASERCHYNRAPLVVKSTIAQVDGRAGFVTYSQIRARVEEGSQVPVVILPGAIPQSFFSVRNKLVRFKVLPSQYGSIGYQNTFATRLRALLPEEIVPSIELFFRDPDSDNSQTQYTVDVVCKLSDLRSWALLTNFVRSSVLSTHCKCFQYTNEVVIRNVNVETKLMFDFIKSLTAEKMRALFAQDVPEAELPSMDKGFLMPNI